ncbi:MAG: DEAD/DEAH box helicase family protein [Oscillospiraceae bacterium]
MELRPYQKAAIDGIRSQWQSGKRRTLLVLPTGCGKTIVFCKLAEHAGAPGPPSPDYGPPG